MTCWCIVATKSDLLEQVEELSSIKDELTIEVCDQGEDFYMYGCQDLRIGMRLMNFVDWKITQWTWTREIQKQDFKIRIAENTGKLFIATQIFVVLGQS